MRLIDWIGGPDALPAGAKVDESVQYFGEGPVLLAPGCRIDTGCVLTGKVSIGRLTHIPPYCVLYGKGGLRIGDLVNLGVGTVVHTESESFDGEWLMGPLVPSHLRRAMLAPVKIGHVATIGAKSTIMPGVDIGAGAIVGAHSLVRASVASLEKVAGAPARRIGWAHPQCLELAKAVLATARK